jgi:hypothetical protein
LEQEVVCKIKELDGLRCECGGKQRVVIKSLPARDWFRPHWNENFDTNPIWVESKAHYKDLCRKYNVTSRALGDVRNIREI